MARTTYVCDGCGAELASKRDLDTQQGTARNTYRCRRCLTTVPAVVAEKLKHQTQN